MRKILLLFIGLCLGFTSAAQVTPVPNPFEATQSVTLNFNKAGTPLASYSGTIYAHIGVTVNGNTWQNVIGQWGQTNQPALTLVSGTTYKLDITPDLFTYFGVAAGSNITQICVVFRNAAGSSQTSDIFINVGSFQASLSAPVLNSTTLVNSGGSLFIAGSNTGGTANYNLLANGTSITTSSGTSFSYTDTNITVNKNYELQISQGTVTFSRRFAVLVNPGTVTESVPAGMVDGINYNSADTSKATLVLTAPGKEYVYVAGSFNNYTPTAAYAMKKDGDKFWIELTGLTPNVDYNYQYWVVDTTPSSGSPALVKTADPYSTLVLSPYDDPYIPAGNYPNLPAYPIEQSREVTVLKTGVAPYNWQVTNFEKPAKEKLVVYEALVRDFDSNRSFQNLIDKIDYFRNLHVNAIELMPVMEFEGTESWGYNTSFHMALDKAYGTEDKLREFIDLCHQNGIAVILDVALNHAFGRNPMVRMWMKDPDGDGWGDAAADNPYFNEFAKHAYSVGNDFNHTSAYTKVYVKRVIKHWIEDFHIDGFRWDLTKGFTQACSASNETCTNQYQQDRVDILKEYAGYSWDLDPTHYTIFEHLGTDNEEKEWANFRLNETPSKGVMMWGKVTDPYNQLSMGYNSSNDISDIGHEGHAGFNGKRVMGYAESHDEERLMYKNLTYGNSANSAHDVKTLPVALSRMSAIGAISILVPGPKMIWHFGELGWEYSIYTCNNGTVNTPSDATSGDCKLDTKPQPQWTNNWLGQTNRSTIYNDWSRMIQMKETLPVFSGDYDLNSGTTLQPKLYVYDTSLPDSQLKNVVVLTNFDVTAQAVVANFPYTGNWYNLMDDSPVSVSNTAMSFTIQPGQFLIFGNQQANLSTDAFDTLYDVALAPNPSRDQFMVNHALKQLEIFSLNGQKVKSFKGDFNESFSYGIGDLPTGLYLVKVTDANNREKTLKLVKH
ncbi:alpha-amylase family glycosyl hydrolase [Flavobacterium silvaticum]|uniref:T9SS type A sorting domain-containing protein n=1 Tax=Flavobacterium silvaticum TaxID=1852020 RepID=A0A972JIC9_9FLAO|nr:alpha-amylase family glycosyl hydrolase [Flavobacterium silvaticum]NMH27162.1 T9SS type A sorting domain-containing protein [Flavobacterium silvaticum]